MPESAKSRSEFPMCTCYAEAAESATYRNAPASGNAVEHLDRRPVTKELLGNEGKRECFICIDELEVGQTAAFLP